MTGPREGPVIPTHISLHFTITSAHFKTSHMPERGFPEIGYMK